MQEQKPRKVVRSLFWLFALLVVVVAWWYFHSTPSAADELSTEALLAEQRALGGDADDILVDFVDSVSPETIARIEGELAIDLELVSDESFDERFYRAHVAKDRRNALLASLRVRSDVEIAEPDAEYALYHHNGERAPKKYKYKYVVKPSAELEPHCGALPVSSCSPEVVRRRGFWERNQVAVLDRGESWQDFPNDPLYVQQWHMLQINMPKAWKLADGEGVIVAVLDTGVAYEDYASFHLVEDLEGVEFVKPYDFVGNTRHANDDHGHGTHVTGTIAQVTHNGVGVTGIGRKLQIMPLKVLSGVGTGSVAGIADAIRYAADNGAHVINMSLGGPFPSRILKKAVRYAHSQGVSVVAAAGNQGQAKVGYPAAYDGVFVVSATQFDEEITFYSNYGKHIDIAAPGGNTQVDQNGDGMPDGVLQNTIEIRVPTKSDYFAYMGTSMASPHVAGVAALVVGEGVSDPDAVARILKSSARKPSQGVLDESRYGAGIVDAEAAVLAARAGTGGWQFLVGLLMAGAMASSLRRRGILGVKLGPGYLVGILFGAGGLFFIPYLAPEIASLPVLDTFTRGLPSWDLGVLGANNHGNALFFSALAPLGLLLLFFGVVRCRAVLAGLSIGVAAHLSYHAVANLSDIHWVPNILGLDTLWLFANAALCIVLAHVTLRR